MSLNYLDGVLRDRTTRLRNLQPLPLMYRLSPQNHRELLALPAVRRQSVDLTPVPWNAHGCIWGVPYIVSEAVPEGCVMFTTDYKEWQVLRVEGAG